jgi:Ca2+-binding RTX toxin-like protein
MLMLASLFGALMLGATSVFTHDTEIEISDASQEDDADAPEEAQLETASGDILSMNDAPADILQGSDEDDLLIGDEDSEQLVGGDGADTLLGGGNDDLLLGQDGDDLLSGDAGADTLNGGFGQDVLDGGSDADDLSGAAGGDVLLGDEGNDSLNGGPGDDLLSGGEGQDALQGGLGNDTLSGGEGLDAMFGGDGDDVVIGSDDLTEDFLNGGAGNDTLVGGAGDWLHGGAGTDSFALDISPEVGGDSTPAVLQDYQPDEDQLYVLYDDSLDASAPELTLDPTDPETGLVDLRMDGTVIAQINEVDGLDPAMITLISATEAAAMGLQAFT